MNANLSLVLDKDGYVRIDLMKDIPISEIDKYTTSCTSSKEIRNKYKEEIAEFLEEKELYIKNFKREQDKKGRIVIVYFDENRNIHRLRVLYEDGKEKTDLDNMIKNIKKSLEEQSTFYQTVDVINRFSGFIFGSGFDRKQIKELKQKMTITPEYEDKYNKRLVKNIIYNHLVESMNRNRERAYFYVRLIDSYIEKYGIKTTKKIVNLNIRQVPKKTKINKNESSFERVKDGNFFMEEDGQYNMFQFIGDKSSKYRSSDMYQEYLDKEEERRLGK